MTKIEKLVTYYETAVHHIFYINIFILIYIKATLAQLVEQLIRNEQVAGSSPAIGSSLKFIRDTV